MRPRESCRVTAGAALPEPSGLSQRQARWYLLTLRRLGRRQLSGPETRLVRKFLHGLEVAPKSEFTQRPSETSPSCGMTVLCAKSLHSHPALCNTIDCSPPGFSAIPVSPGKNTGVDCLALLQRIFLTQGLNPRLLCLLHCRHSLPLSHQGTVYLEVNL